MNFNNVVLNCTQIVHKMSTSFSSDVYFVTSQIPKGYVSTYKLIAEAIGRPKSYRAVGQSLSVNPYAPKIPCHRVISSDGGIGGFFGTKSKTSDNVYKKIEILKSEGISFTEKGKVKDFQSLLYKPRKMVKIEFDP